VRILCNRCGFHVVRQRGSHVILRKDAGDETRATVVPLHDDLKIGTLKGILRLARVSEQEFAEHQ